MCIMHKGSGRVFSRLIVGARGCPKIANCSNYPFEETLEAILYLVLTEAKLEEEKGYRQGYELILEKESGSWCGFCVLPWAEVRFSEGHQSMDIETSGGSDDATLCRVVYSCISLLLHVTNSSQTPVKSYPFSTPSPSSIPTPPLLVSGDSFCICTYTASDLNALLYVTFPTWMLITLLFTGSLE